MLKIEDTGILKGYIVYQKSQIKLDNTLFCLVKDEQSLEKSLYIKGNVPDGFCSGRQIEGGYLFPQDVKNAYKLAKIFPHLMARPLGVGKPSFGFGDRIGMATSGHVLSLGDKPIKPIFAQQSIREMARTKRTPEEVMADAIWGVFQEGYKGGFGSDADHLKTEDDAKNLADAGFTMFTCDPSDYVNNHAGRMSISELKEALKDIEDSSEFFKKYLGRRFELSGHFIIFEEDPLARAIVKYAKALSHAEHMYRFIKNYVKTEFDFELSIDETDEPTTPLEHLFIAKELRDRDIKVTGIAPRFIGDFQKAIDYIGDLSQFVKEFRLHIEISKKFGPYKISVHSGSDKFSIYPIIGKYGENLFHVKTAGTSYLEALRVIAMYEPEFFAKIYMFSYERFAEDRASYHLTTDLSLVPDIKKIPKERYPTLLDKNDPRQVLHVAYGSILTAKDENNGYLFRDKFMEILKKHEREYEEVLLKHFEKHLTPLIENG